MNRQVITLAVLLSVSAASAQANEWELLPILGDSYQFNPSVALIGGSVDFKDGNKINTGGVELSIDCPLLKPPHHTIRQQISYSTTDDNGVETSSFELNPHHMFNLSNKLQVGAGPSLGFTKVDTGTNDDTVFTYGVGASAKYNFTQNLFLGAEVRHAWSDDVDLGGQTSELENTRALAKIGYQF